MPKVSFNPESLGRARKVESDMSCPSARGAFVPVMVFKPGIEAIMEGIRLSNIESLPPAGAGFSGENVDTRIGDALSPNRKD